MRLRSLVSVVAPPLCAGCGAGAGRVEPLCPDCRRGLRTHGGVEVVLGVPTWAAFAYEGGARALVRALKFRGTAAVAMTMAAQMAAGAPDELLAGVALVPVPLHPARRRRRGFNQAELLARELAGRRGLPVADCLARAGTRATQVGRGRSERLTAIESAIRVREGASLPSRALLVDDVITTGATASACAAALRAAGVEVAGALAYARTLGR
jgi:ComF family protein